LAVEPDEGTARVSGGGSDKAGDDCTGGRGDEEGGGRGGHVVDVLMATPPVGRPSEEATS